MTWILLSLGIVICGALASAITALLEQRRIRTFVLAAVDRAGIELLECEVKIGFGWPVHHKLQIEVVLADEEDSMAMHTVMAHVWDWIDKRYGVERD